MAARLTDKQKKKIIADYVENGSYRATARINGVSTDTVKRIVLSDGEIVQKATQKKEQNTADMLAYMDDRKEQAKKVLDSCLDALADPAKIKAAKLSEIATAMGIVIDKFINIPINNQLHEKKFELELLKLESRMQDNAPEEDAEDNFLQALNASAQEVWGDDV